MSDIIFKQEVSLQVPISRPAPEGQVNEIRTLAFSRPKSLHAMRIASVFGVDLVTAMFGASDAEKKDGKGAETFRQVILALVDFDKLKVLIEILADLTGQTVDVIEQVDLIDMPKVWGALFGFFPELQSLVSMNFQQIVQRTSDGLQAKFETSTGSTS